MARAIHILRTCPKARVVTTVLLNVWTCFVCPRARPHMGCSSLTWVSLPVRPPLWDLSTRVVLMVSSCRACSVDANNPGEREEDRCHPLTDGETALGGAAEVCKLARSRMLIRPLVWSLGWNSYLKVRRCTSLEGRCWPTCNCDPLVLILKSIFSGVIVHIMFALLCSLTLLQTAVYVWSNRSFYWGLFCEIRN